jgi:hypothetical protein
LTTRTAIVPCLHDEPTAQLPVFDRMFRDVRGCWFLTEPEADLARALRSDLAESREIGCGVTAPDRYAPQRFRDRFGIAGRFVLYAGRRESAKGFELVVDQFVDAVEREQLPLKLVVAGPGSVHVSDRARPRRRDGCGRCCASAVGVRELLAHDDGGVASRNAGDRKRRERRESMAL